LPKGPLSRQPEPWLYWQKEETVEKRGYGKTEGFSSEYLLKDQI
jgi:hypothetical protein